MTLTKKLPDAEFALMKIIWKSNPPITTTQIISKLDKKNSWKPQTVLTLLVRLIEKRFLQSEKVGKERCYTPLVSEREYTQFETGSFVSKYHDNSVVALVNTLFDGKQMSEQDISDLKDWLAERM